MPAHSYFLVKGSGGANGVEIPRTPDAVSSLGLAATAGQVFLADTSAGINPVTGGTTVAQGGSIDYSAGKVIDFLGYGSGTTSYEGALKTGTITTAGSYKRQGAPSDTDNNNTDFTISAVAPGPDNCDCVAPTLKITEVYTEGGNAGSAVSHDYVEIHNPGTSALPLSGLTLQYRAPGATGAATVVVPLSGTLGAGSYDVAQLASGGSNGAPVSGVDYTNATLDLDTAGGTVFIAKRSAGYDPGTGDFGPDQFVADLVGFTAMSSDMPPGEVVTLLNGLFTRFDEAAHQLGIEKIKTVGDAYMAVCGMPVPVPDHAERMVRMAIRMVHITREHALEHHVTMKLRVGVNSGPVVAGVPRSCQPAMAPSTTPTATQPAMRTARRTRPARRMRSRRSGTGSASTPS